MYFKKPKNSIGICYNCGNQLLVKINDMGERFIGCSKYPDCSNSYSIPQKGSIKESLNLCNFCNLPLIKIRISRTETTEMCPNNECPSKRKV